MLLLHTPDDFVFGFCVVAPQVLNPVQGGLPLQKHFSGTGELAVLQGLALARRLAPL